MTGAGGAFLPGPPQKTRKHRPEDARTHPPTSANHPRRALLVSLSIKRYERRRERDKFSRRAFQAKL